LLLDTQAFLWFLLDDPKLRATARSLIANPNNEIEVSPATYWEIAIKIALRKYELPEPFEVFMERDRDQRFPHSAHRAKARSIINDDAVPSSRSI
jgi:PIN domain nuclease of toxin-antitoxin system